MVFQVLLKKKFTSDPFLQLKIVRRLQKDIPGKEAFLCFQKLIKVRSGIKGNNKFAEISLIFITNMSL